MIHEVVVTNYSEMSLQVKYLWEPQIGNILFSLPIIVALHLYYVFISYVILYSWLYPSYIITEFDEKCSNIALRCLAQMFIMILVAKVCY